MSYRGGAYRRGPLDWNVDLSLRITIMWWKWPKIRLICNHEFLSYGLEIWAGPFLLSLGVDDD